MKKHLIFLLAVLLFGNLQAQSWQTYIPELYTSFEDIVAIDSNNCFAVGIKGRIYKTTDGGNSWTLLSTGVTETLSSVCYVGGVLYVTVPKTGKVLRSSNLQSFDSYQLNGYNGNSVYFFNENFGYISNGQEGKIAKTSNGGISWQIIETTFKGYIRKVYFQTEQVGFAIAHIKENNTPKAVILKTTDGGNNWQEVFSRVNEQLNDITFTDANYGYVVGGNGKIYRTTDGGITFSTLTSNVTTNLTDISFADLYVGYAVGNMGTILKTTNRGATWQVLNHPKQMPFTKACFQGNIGYVSTAGNTILKTVNGAQ